MVLLEYFNREKIVSFLSRGEKSKVKVKSLSRVQLFATPWTVAYQASLSMGFSRQGYRSGLPFPSPGIFPTQVSNPGLPHCRQTLYCLSHILLIPSFACYSHLGSKNPATPSVSRVILLSRSS